MYITREQASVLQKKAAELEQAILSSDIDWSNISSVKKMDIVCSPRYIFLHISTSEDPQIAKALEELQWFKSKFTSELSTKVTKIVGELDILLEDAVGGVKDA